MKATKVICFRSNPSSIYWVMLRVWLQQDLPGLKPACSGIIVCSMISETRLRTNISRTLNRWHSKETGLKFVGSVGSFPGFRSAITLAFLQDFGICIVATHLFIICVSQFIVRGSKCLICSDRISSRPAAVFSFKCWIQWSIKWSLDYSMRLFRFDRLCPTLFTTTYCKSWAPFLLQLVYLKKITFSFARILLNLVLNQNVIYSFKISISKRTFL